MQNVATGKSELAALPLMFKSDSSDLAKDFSEFKTFLKEARDQHFDQPVEPDVPIIMDDKKLSEAKLTSEAKSETEAKSESEAKAEAEIATETELAPTENIPTEKILEGADQQVDTGQSSNMAVPLSVVASAVDVDILDLKVNQTIENQSNNNIDLAAELDNIIPSIDLLDLLEQSQFKEITISRAQKIETTDQYKDIQELVAQLTTLSEQIGISADADTDVNPQTINAILNKLVVALDQYNIDSESPIKLTELVSKIRTDFELESNAKTLPSIESDEQAVLDIELLTIVVAEEKPTAETPVLSQGLLAQAQKDITEPLQQTTKINLEADFSEESEAVVAVAQELEVLEEPQLMQEEVIERPYVSTQPIETKILSRSAESKDMQQILALSPEKLDKALENLANRLIQTDSATSQESENQPKIPSAIKQDFIASLKTNIDEIKSQLKQGKQIDLDLKSVVVDSLKQMSQEFNPESVSATVSRFTQTLELSSTLLANASINSPVGLETAVSTESIDRVLTKESQSQNNLLQVKQAKQQVIQFEKSVNIVRSEGLNQLVEKVRWMVNQNNLQADIRLDPPDLGAMKVRVSLSGETASVNIVVQSQQAKDLLDSAAPKLRDLLEEQGIQLGQSSVEQEQSQTDQNSTEVAGGNSDLSNETEPEEAQIVTEQTIVNGRLGGIDYFV